MIVRAVALAAVLSLGSPAAFAADAVKPVPVHFAKGATSATVKGAVKGEDSVEYRIVARAGQRLRVTLADRSPVDFNVYPPAGHASPDPQVSALPLESSFSPAGESRSGVLPADGEYRISVFLPRAFARRGAIGKFSLEIDVR